MIAGTYVAAVALFSLAFFYTRIMQTVSQIVSIACDSIQTLTDSRLDDDAKEKAIRQAAFGMLKSCGWLLIKGATTFAAAVTPFYLADTAALATLEDTSRFALRWDVLLVTTLVAVAAGMIWHKLVRGRMAAPSADEAPYSRLDRLVHNMAFGSPMLQRVMGDVEKKLFTREWTRATVQRPIFITSLPRAGTTILLEALHRLPGIATHTYRDMPFILTPVLWDRISSRFRRQKAQVERAHGDGLVVNEDSPEAFEEVLWRTYFSHKYSESGIALWRNPDARFVKYFREHMQKILVLRQPERLGDGRYVSKNNNNIARIQALKGMFSDAFIVVLVRDPIEHAISLWRQHQNFFKRHATDPFVRKYMEDIGHYEFGALHRPIKFPGLDVLIEDLAPDVVDYWVAYWIAAFEHLSAYEGIDFLSYESLCQAPAKSLTQLSRHLGIQATGSEIDTAAALFRASPPSRKHTFSVDEDLSERAVALHRNLLCRGHFVLSKPPP